MTLSALGLAETGLVPDAIIRVGIRALLDKTLAREEALAAEVAAGKRPPLARVLAEGPVAVHTDRANEQHYELPAAFFEAVLGPRLKYSSGLWPTTTTSFEQSEEAALAETCQHARLTDGLDILELGCGWGSLTLYMAEHYPTSRITAVSNSHSQRAFIEERCRQRNLSNVRIITCDVNALKLDERFDRLVSVEMLEHVRNHRELLGRARHWLRPDGLLFVHVFAHLVHSYTFEETRADDWMAHHFFSGGLMPGVTLLPEQGRGLFELEGRWIWDGTHYQRTSEAWLARFDAARDQMEAIFRPVYGADTRIWLQRWRIFFMSCAELFGYKGGQQWLVAHYLLRPLP